MVTGIGGVVLTATQFVVPAMVNWTGQLSVGVITMMTGLTVWWRKRQQRLSEDEILATLMGLTTNHSGASVEPKAVAVTTFVIAAYLLASNTEPPKAWFEYLDEVEAALERQ